MWKKTLALLFGFLILGVTFSGASATASFVNGTVNSTIELPQNAYSLKRPGDRIKPNFFPGIAATIEILVGSKELLVLTVGLATLAIKGLHEVIKKYGGKVTEFILKATGFKQLAEFGDGFIGTVGHSMEHPKVQVYLKKIWIFSTPFADKLVIKDGSRTLVEVKKSELDQVDDLFSPKEFGRLLGEAYLNGWDTEKAEEFAKELYRETRNLPKFGGRSASCGYWPPGKVKLYEADLRHIIRRHFKREIYYGEPDATAFPKSISAEWLANVIKQAILAGEVNCDKSNSREVALEVNTKLGRVRVVLRQIGSKTYKIVTVYLSK
ncbi:hypothetical protein [Palaeococcus ferrophilus]|uniref:hypothetical protein n=1 Tax=Palaeococcus ferrophilus TaxID=83868 RepID=UPI00064E585E|nr:hypothetical protein [Palaeococcus ferrophilus]